MSLKYPLINVEEFAEKYSNKSHFLTPITSAQGSSTTAFYNVLAPNDLPKILKHNNCDIISILLSGCGFFGIGDNVISAHPGDCGFVKKGTEHFFVNTSNEVSLMVGFFLGAKNINETGLETSGSLKSKKFEIINDRNQINHEKDGTIVNVKDVDQEKMDETDGWKITDIRLPISTKNGSSSTLFRARFMPGAVHKKHCHKNSDEIYFIISGHGLAGAGSDRVEVHGGYFHFIPKGVEHWLYNLSNTKPLEVVGIYCEAGSVENTGYVYMGDVTTNDLNERTK